MPPCGCWGRRPNFRIRFQGGCAAAGAQRVGPGGVGLWRRADDDVIHARAGGDGRLAIATRGRHLAVVCSWPLLTGVRDSSVFGGRPQIWIPRATVTENGPPERHCSFSPHCKNQAPQLQELSSGNESRACWVRIRDLLDGQMSADGAYFELGTTMADSDTGPWTESRPDPVANVCLEGTRWA